MCDAWYWYYMWYTLFRMQQSIHEKIAKKLIFISYEINWLQMSVNYGEVLHTI